jgi:hypothetical protein
MRLLVVILVVGLALMVSAQNDCKGQVGAYSYDLTPLAQKLGTALLRADAGDLGVFWYSVCAAQTPCVSAYDTRATVCLFTSSPTMWWRVNARFKPLASGNDAKGFTLYIPNGYGGDPNPHRGVAISFIWYLAYPFHSVASAG